LWGDSVAKGRVVCEYVGETARAAMRGLSRVGAGGEVFCSAVGELGLWRVLVWLI
jgi:hypothetical protein